MKRMIYDQENMCYRTMSDDEVMLQKIKKSLGVKKEYDKKEDDWKDEHIAAKSEIRPSIHSNIPEANKDITKVNYIEIKRAQSGREYLVLYVESKDKEFDETVILGDDGYLTKISRDIVESLEQVKRIDTDIFLETEF